MAAGKQFIRGQVLGLVGRLLLGAGTVASVLALAGTVFLWVELDRGQFWIDLIYVAPGSRCYILKSTRSLPNHRAMLVFMTESPWPQAEPLSWFSGDAAHRPVGPTRAGQITFQNVMDVGGVRMLRWQGFGVGRWADGTILYDSPGYKAASFSPPMDGWSFSLPHSYAVVLMGILPGVWVVRRVKRGLSPKGRLCPECAFDVPIGVGRCPDCGRVLQYETFVEAELPLSSAGGIRKERPAGVAAPAASVAVPRN